jgi:hypothetical protein
MSWTRWLLIPALLAVIGSAQVASAQHQPGRDYRPFPIDADAAAVLKKRLLEAYLLDDLQDLISDIRKNPEKYKALSKMNSGDELDPATRDALEKLLKKSVGADGKLDADKLKVLQKDLQKQLEAKQQGDAPDPKGLASKPDATEGKGTKKTNPMLFNPVPKNSSKSNKFFKDLSNSKLLKPLWKSQAGREAKQQIDKQDIGYGSAGAGNKSSKAGDAAANAMSNMDLNDSGSKMSLPGLDLLKSLKSGSDSSDGLPLADSGGPANLGSLASPPSFSLAGAAGASGGLLFVQFLLILVVAVTVLVLLWQLLTRAKTRDVQAALRRSVWPLPPGQVSTRQQLIQAFEHLALVVLGPGARSSNHRDIAMELGATPARTQAADELATLYERARYDPVEGELPDADLAAARRDLCLLAGMAAS